MKGILIDKAEIEKLKLAYQKLSEQNSSPQTKEEKPTTVEIECVLEECES